MQLAIWKAVSFVLLTATLAGQGKVSAVQVSTSFTFTSTPTFIAAVHDIVRHALHYELFEQPSHFVHFKLGELG